MEELPDTIKYPHAFTTSKPAGYDGLFDWTWTKGCFGNGNITPMDFDGVVERKGHYIVFETKNLGVEISDGQKRCLDGLRYAKSFTVVKIWGKKEPEKIEIIYPNGRKKSYHGVEEVKERVRAWYRAADEEKIRSK